MYTKDYIQATYEVMHDAKDPASVLPSLRTYLTQRGLQKMYPVVLRGLIEKIYRKNRTTKPKIIVAREKDFKKHHSAIQSILTELKTTEEPETRIDGSLIGGYIVQGASDRVDRSYKNKLLHIYRSLID